MKKAFLFRNAFGFALYMMLFRSLRRRDPLAPFSRLTNAQSPRIANTSTHSFATSLPECDAFVLGCL